MKSNKNNLLLLLQGSLTPTRPDSISNDFDFNHSLLKQAAYLLKISLETRGNKKRKLSKFFLMILVLIFESGQKNYSEIFFLKFNYGLAEVTASEFRITYWSTWAFYYETEEKRTDLSFLISIKMNLTSSYEVMQIYFVEKSRFTTSPPRIPGKNATYLLSIRPPWRNFKEGFNDLFTARGRNVSIAILFWMILSLFL